jgi:hypothetical protein
VRALIQPEQEQLLSVRIEQQIDPVVPNHRLTIGSTQILLERVVFGGSSPQVVILDYGMGCIAGSIESRPHSLQISNQILDRIRSGCARSGFRDRKQTGHSRTGIQYLRDVRGNDRPYPELKCVGLPNDLQGPERHERSGPRILRNDQHVC